jgi:hypothetical protein
MRDRAHDKAQSTMPESNSVQAFHGRNSNTTHARQLPSSAPTPPPPRTCEFPPPSPHTHHHHRRNPRTRQQLHQYAAQGPDVAGEGPAQAQNDLGRAAGRGGGGGGGRRWVRALRAVEGGTDSVGGA